MRFPRKPFVPICSSLMALALVLVSAPETAAAPPGIPALKWGRSIGRAVESVAVDGAVYVTGFRVSDDHEHMFVRRLTSGGDTVWTRTWEPRRANAAGTDLALGGDGALYVVGRVGVDGSEGHGWFIRKFRPDGTLRWQRTTPDWRKGAQQAFSDVAVGDHQVVVSGYDFRCCGDVDRAGWVQAFDPHGDPLWRYEFEFPHLRRFNDQASALDVGGRGDVYVAGWVATAREKSDSDLEDHEVVVERLTSSGAPIWTRIYRDRHSNDRDEATDVSVLNGLVVVGAFLDSGSEYLLSRPAGHAWVARLTLRGTQVWATAWGLAHERAARPESVAIDLSSAIFVAGSARDPSDRGTDAFVRSLAENGSVLWDRSLQGARYVYGTDVATGPGALYLSGFEEHGGSESDGRLWRFGG